MNFPKLPEGEPRKGVLRPEMYQKLLLELPDHLRLLFVIATMWGVAVEPSCESNGPKLIGSGHASGGREEGEADSPPGNDP